ncbi:alkyl hydroperoxide reductase AhpD [Polaribacter pacificus]|uniref:Alkyl hydroperoxide reductase AhpD n=1 Tax=Polaribacter pacificus TaxID=1775173 RepID=A0A917I0W9_9FLAO|nr:peroxidase-related enzyme [Polaribacter pacificus]GGH00652.1 alkyl hydroperoxide reductase AhpD [Polaribacter pacificus]
MSWIKTISFEDATGKLKRLYEKVTGPNNNVDNIMMVHGLRPHTMTGHMALYKNVLHNSNNSLPKWYLETIGVYVSLLNNCDYCINHHFEGLRRLIDNDKKANQIKSDLENENQPFEENSYNSGLEYAKRLTLEPSDLQENDVISLRSEGLSDGEILEINQVVSYFNYANRTVLGLGVSTKGDIIGLSPSNSDDENHWNHQ